MAVTGASERSAGERGLTAGQLAVTRQLLIHGPATRGDLGDRLNLSYASMSRLARALIGGGIATEDPESAAAIGRPRHVLTAVPSARHVVGVKLTGDTAYGVVCDLFGDVKATTRAALPRPEEDGVVPVAGTVKLIAQLANRLAPKVPSVDGIGVAVGGVIADRSVVREGTFLGWRDVDLGTPLQDRSGLPVIVTNDVTALAREQLWFGAGRTHSTFGIVTVGAGLGVGVVREGVAVEELIDNGHLLAHSPVDGSGPTCTLGHRGCVAAYLNREDLERHASAAAKHPVTLTDLVRARSGGDPAAARRLDDAARALGHVVASFAGALQTTCIVLAGEDIAAFTDSPALQAAIDDRLRPGPLETQRCALEVVATPLTFTDWARGAAVAGIQHVLGA
ncbi:ROK family transcriptional regulator [Kribbella kalugense]|uniref:Putative NBD/HSP70 family sugar kinase n=1 Tax=Kribbella kalugense TaxID=2512221 RepID=A0A4R7ZYP6_9ACTN|nr:ROK family transcriptional regulator [Kribbella kalugense]TDW23259.1 putative NBD/HSP70 family sugar kinase [Kribbella kalugense]